VVRTIADTVSVFERGRLLETGPTAELFSAPRHSYTRRLISAVPVVTKEEAVFRDRIRALAE
jgi:peptide/nickel transport system ATP-binding protein